MPEKDHGSAGLSGVRAEAKEGLREGREQVRSFLNERKSTAADQAHGFADALRETAQVLEEKGDGSPATHYVERAAEAIDSLAERVQHGDVDELLGETRRLAQRSPALFIGGAIVLGVLLGRLLRSSRSHEEVHDYDRGRYRPNGGGGNRDGHRWQGEVSPMAARMSREGDPQASGGVS